MSPRFFTEQLPDTVVLTGSEAHHLGSVMRLKSGAEVELFDGQGRRATARVVEVGKREVTLEVVERFDEETWIDPEIILATAVPKGERFRSLVEKLTELAVDRLVPLQTEHSVVHPGSGKQKKMHDTVVAACKQCGRNRLMAVDPLTGLGDVVAWGEQDETAVVIAQPGGGDAGAVLEELARCDLARVVLCVGPEGGWSAGELDAADAAGAGRVDLGQHVLRIETAAMALATLARHFLG